MLVTGVKFVRAEKKFVARVQYTNANGDFVARHIEVSEEWVKKKQDLLMMSSTTCLRSIPIKGIFPFQLICRSKLKQKRNILDMDKVLKLNHMHKDDICLGGSSKSGFSLLGSHKYSILK